MFVANGQGTEEIRSRINLARSDCAPINTCCGAGVLGEKPVFYQFAALVCRLVLVP